MNKLLALMLVVPLLSHAFSRQPSHSSQPLGRNAALFTSSSLTGNKIHHVIIVVQENRTPDNLFQGLPGADIATWGYDSHGLRVPLVPRPLETTYDIRHDHQTFLVSFRYGHMNGFDQARFLCALPCAGATAYGYVPQTETAPYLSMAEQYTFGDRMFQTNQGPSFPAHQYLIAGTSLYKTGSNLLAAENPLYFGGNTLNCDGSALSRVLLIDPFGNEGYGSTPCMEHATLFDLLDAHGVSWRYYESYLGSNWSAPDAIRHIRFGGDWNNVVLPQNQVLADIAGGRLASVSWVMPSAQSSDHSRTTDGSGPSWVASIVNAVGTSAYWNDTAIIVTWDDWGGWYDHVTPPIRTSYESGFRVPLIVISPYAKRHYVSHENHEFGSILHFVEDTYGLGSLGYSDATADNLDDCFDFTQTPAPFTTIQAPLPPAYFLRQPLSTGSPDGD